MSSQRLLIVICVASIFLGSFFRTFHIDWKLYSFDETVTSLRVAGHTYGEFEKFVHDGQTHNLKDLESFQQPSNLTTGASIWNSLAVEDPQHPPLYFYCSTFVQRLFGDSLVLRRAPAVIFSLLVLPAAWWLALELFSDRLTAWTFAALVAVSPFHVVYAQQAREYSLWTLLTLLSSAALLHVLRTRRRWAIVGYGISIGLGLWSFVFFLEICVTHILYLLVPRIGTKARTRLYLLIALACGLVSFVPWLRVLLRGIHTVASDTGWTSSRLPLALYLGKWIFNVGSVFFDLDYLTIALLPIAFVFVGLGVWSTWTLLKQGDSRVWSFVFLLGGCRPQLS